MNCKHRTKEGSCDIGPKRCTLLRYAFCDQGSLELTLTILAMLAFLVGGLTVITMLEWGWLTVKWTY